MVPADILNQLKAFGEASFEAKVSSRPIADPRFSWANFFSKASEALRANSAQAIGEIHAAASDDHLGQFGGYSLIAEFDATTTDARYLEMMDASLQMMFDRQLSSGHLNRYEADRWIATHDDLRTSFDRIEDVPPPPPDHTAEVTLDRDESLMVAMMGPGALDNQFWIEHTITGTYAAFSMRVWESGDATLTRCAEDSIGSWESIEGVLQSLGGQLGTRPYWAHEQLDPYFTQRRGL